MNTNQVSKEAESMSLRKASVIAGIGLLIMEVSAATKIASYKIQICLISKEPKATGSIKILNPILIERRSINIFLK